MERNSYSNQRTRKRVSPAPSSSRNAAILMVFHRIGEFAVLAVIAIAITSILSEAAGSRISAVQAFAPATITKRTFDGALDSRPSQFLKHASSRPLHTRASRLMPLNAADTSPPPTTGKSSSIGDEIPRIGASDLKTLLDDGYVIIENFLPSESWMEALRGDVMNLRDEKKFKIAKIGQDSTNALNEEIRVAETCFIGRDKPELQDAPNPVREKLYDILEALRVDLESSGPTSLDPNLSEFLYAYYPKGGFYRRHRDAIKGSASWLREYSFLLYLNEDSYDAEVDGGRLRMHFDSGGDFLPEGEAPLFQDVDACGGTLVIFESFRFPHEVLDTVAERFAVVGWYNRPMTLADISNVTDNGGGVGADDTMKLVALAAAAGLVTVGLLNLVF